MCFYFFFNDTATTEIYTLSLHDALPIWQNNSISPIISTAASFASLADQCGSGCVSGTPGERMSAETVGQSSCRRSPVSDRKSTRLNSSHANISYAVFCLKKKKPTKITQY